MALGYSGWGAGQLEDEISRNAWLTVPGDPEVIFNTPFDKRLVSAADLLGIDIHLISGRAGHA